MGDFFKGRHFKVLFALFIIILAFTIRGVVDGTGTTLLSRATSWFTTPIQRFAAGVSQSISDSLSEAFQGKRLAQENESLRQENAELRNQLVDYERYRAENERLRAYLSLKETSPDLEFASAQVIGRDVAERFYSFTIDVGTRDGVKVDDPVITSEGLVGFVTAVNGTSSQVSTLLDVSVSVGAMDITTREIGVTEGTVALAQDGYLRLSYLPRESSAAPGDIVVTTGTGGICPNNLVVGTIREVSPDAKGLSLYAVIEPPADLRDVSDVLVITAFNRGDETTEADTQPEE